MTKFGRIYIIRNTINNKVYIGQTKVSIKLRFINHLSAARNGKDYVIGKAIRKYGEENFYIELLEECTVEELNEREIYWISFFNSTNPKFGYNMSIGGHCPTSLRNLDENQVIEMFNNGKSAFQIAKELHTAVFKVTDILRKYNITYGIEKQRISKELESIIIDLYLDGYGSLTIAKYLNINKTTVLRTLKRNNIETRTMKETKNIKKKPLDGIIPTHESTAEQ